MKLPAVFMVLLSLSSCARAVGVPEVPPLHEPLDSSTEPKRTTASPISLGRLPDRGFVVAGKRGTVFLDLTGRVLREVPRIEIVSNSGPSQMWFSGDDSYFRLDLDEGALDPVTRKLANNRMRRENRQEVEPELPIPAEAPRIKGMLVGHWRYAIPSPSGDVLGQWSGECEVPTAYWITGGELRIITGEYEQGEAPDSTALGWSEDGRAFAYLGEGFCGDRGDPPGIYSFTSPGAGELLYQTPKYAQVQMWVR
jgi:hypothetical protein